MPIRTLIFDLGQVIIPFDWKRGYAALAGFSPYPPEEIRSRIKETGLFGIFERGQVEPGDLAQRLSAVLELNVPFEKFRQLWSSIFLPETILPDEMLARLHAHYRLLLLSNTDAIHYSWVAEKYPIMRHFDHCVLSFEIGLRKPEPGIYQEAIRQARCAASEIFFTDDIAENVEGARLAGVDAVQFQSLAQLHGDLNSRGIRW
jgi:putative hydrolase of the HAD superfamily